MENNRIRELIELLNNASRAYYQENREIMSDFEYDRLYDELLELEKNGTVYSDSPTQRVGYELLTELRKVNHGSRMLSLDKTKETEKLISFLGDKEGILSWKLDGLTIVLSYKDGELFQGVTRGNGEVGEDITHNAKTFRNIPLKIPYKGELVVRGEAIIRFSDFEKINEELSADEKYKNPRNLCSGTVRQLNSEICGKRNIRFYAFSLVEPVLESEKRSESLKYLSELGFETVESVLVNAQNVAGIVEEFKNKINDNNFASDGLVLSYNDEAYGKSLGTTSKFPRDSIAYKWQDDVAETSLLNILWNPSRTGLINPIAEFSPVELEGTTVSRASVHNLSIVEGLKLGIGDRITVYKANMIIPQIADNLTKSGTVLPPEVCPACKNQTKIVEENGVKSVYCTSPQCPAKGIGQLTHFVSRDAMNIEGLSEQTLEKFVEAGILGDYPEIFEIGLHKEVITKIPGFGQKSYDNLIKSIEKSKNCRLHNFIYALGIPQVGLSNAKLLCKHFGYDLDKMIEAQASEIEEIGGFGEVIANCVFDYFHDQKNIERLKKVLPYLNFEDTKQEKVEKDASILENKTFVITGDLNTFKNRNELVEKIEELGGKVSGSVSKKTDYLINNDNESESSKNKKAKELGILIITENEFIKNFL